VTLITDFKVKILVNVKITQKRYTIELHLQWRSNRKCYMIYRTAPFSMTLKHPCVRF